MTPSWNPKRVRVPKSNESAVLCAFLMLFVQIAPENSLECGECLQDPEGLRRCVSSRRQRTLFHQFLILQIGPEFSRNSRLGADALPADRAGDSDAGCGKFSPGST